MPETDPASRLENSPDNQQKEEVQRKIRDFFLSELFSKGSPTEIDFDKIKETFKNIDIKNKVSVSENETFKKYGIEGHLIRTTINNQICILFIDSTNSVWKIKPREMSFLCDTTGEGILNVENIDLNSLKESIATRFRQIENSSKLKALKNQ
ncbi:MAG: hypothetical protein WC070_01105 [Candidatus Magasanikbacteria bacterium]